MKKTDLQEELDAAKETIEALQRRLSLIEGGGKHTPFQQQLRSYQQRIEEEAIKLKESQNWANLLVENTMDAIIGLNQKGEITHWNPKSKEMYGWSESEVIGKILHTLLSPDTPNEFSSHKIKQHYLHVDQISANLAERIEILTHCKDGSQISVESLIFQLHQGTSDSYVIFLSDISDRKRAELLLRKSNEELEQLVEERSQEVKRSEQRFALAMRGANDGLWDWNLETDEVYYSPRWKSMLGYADKELEGRLDTWAMLVHPKDKEWVLKKVQDYLEGLSDSFHVEMRMCHKNGTEVVILSRAFLVNRESDGKPVRLVGTHVDITERKQTEEGLRKLSQAVHQAGEGILITDRYASIEYVNPAFSTITGYTLTEISGNTPAMFKSSAQDPLFYKNLWNTITIGEVWNGTLTNRRKDGSFYPALMSIAPIHNNSGEITHYVSLQQDMTEHRKLEEKFIQSQKMEAIGTLVGGIAHDFNNMLAAIQGNVYLSKLKLENPSEVIEKLNNVEQLSIRAADMVKQLLTFARKDHVTMSSFSINAFIKDGVNLAKAAIPENIAFTTDLCQEDLIIYGDRTQLQQVLMNLLNNARDATADVYKPKIELVLSPFIADDRFKHTHPDLNVEHLIMLTIRDNGYGIASNHVNKIFEPFFTTKGVGEGTGLGLSMVYGSVQSHGGVIEVTSETGTGTTINIYLPSKECPKNPRQTVQKNIIQTIEETILLVDDEESMLNTTVEVLNCLGYKVLKANNGEAALKTFKTHQDVIDLILTDVVMPKMGGVELAESIRRIDHAVPIIFATGYDKEHAISANDQIINSTIISKPFPFDELSQLMQRMIFSN